MIRTIPDDGQVTEAGLRPIRIEGDIAYIPLTKGYEAVIDAADVPLVKDFNWQAIIARRSDGSIIAVYAMRGEWLGRGKQRTIRLHRLLLSAPDGVEVDHKDGDGLNNRRANIRLATVPQNRRNARLSVANTSGVKGVTWSAKSRKWQAQIRADGHNHYLGLFESIRDASSAYAAASKKYHGDFGRTA